MEFFAEKLPIQMSLYYLKAGDYNGSKVELKGSITLIR